MVTFGLYGMTFNATERRATGLGIVTNAKLLLGPKTTRKSAIFVATGEVAGQTVRLVRYIVTSVELV